MYSKLPNASTPKLVPKLSSRRPISQRVEYYSPISTMSNIDSDKLLELEVPEMSDDEDETFSQQYSNTSDSGASDVDNNRHANSPKKIEASESSTNNQNTNTTNENTYMTKIWGVVVVAIIGCTVCAIGKDYCIPGIPSAPPTIDTLKSSFPHQDENFWAYIKSGILEIETFEKPSVIVLMYKGVMSERTNELVDSIAEYGGCILNQNCQVKPILLRGRDLNSEETKEDYGVIVKKYKEELEDKHIMIVKNIEEIIGTVAQALHSFCDEYAPLVKKSLFLFTIEVDEYYGTEYQQVVNILKKQWNEIGADKLEALITRVASIILRVN